LSRLSQSDSIIARGWAIHGPSASGKVVIEEQWWPAPMIDATLLEAYHVELGNGFRRHAPE